MAHPVPGYRVTTGFKKPGRLWAVGYHTGVDIAAPSGTQIHSITSGKVVHVGWGGWGRAYGAHVIVDDGHGHRFGYMHMSRTSVRSGQHVKAGQVIGRVGTTGNSTGPHLHIDARTSPYLYNNHIFDASAFFGVNPPVLLGGSSTPAVYLNRLHYGQKNSDSVRALKKALKAHSAIPKHLRAAITRSGNYGGSVDAAVRWCQKHHGYGPTVGKSDPKHKSSVGKRQAKHLGLL